MKAVLYREWRSLIAYKPILITYILSPSLYLLAFGTIMTAAVGHISYNGESVPYLNFFVPGLIILQSFGRYGWLTSHASNDRRWGIFRLFITSNVSPTEYVLGKLLFTCLIVAMQVIALMIVAAAIGAGPAALVSASAILCIVFLSTVFFSCLGMTIGFKARNENSRESIKALTALPFTLLSSAFYDVSAAPVLIRAIARVNPITFAVNAAREVYLTGALVSWGNLVCLAAAAAAAFWVCIRTVRSTPLVAA